MVGRASLPKYVAAAARNKPLAAELLASRGKPPMRMIVAHVIDIRLGQPSSLFPRSLFRFSLFAPRNRTVHAEAETHNKPKLVP